MIPRPEHPNPQMQREEWLNLNGEWEFEFDDGRSGEEQKWFLDKIFSKKITVPFCPESKLSGIERTDFINAVWYKRRFTIPAEAKEKRIHLHFGAVDYLTKVYLNGKYVGKHAGGFSSFSFDITDDVALGENTLVVYAQDDVRSKRQPGGKQSSRLLSFACSYTRTTGIWQTVWLEFLPQNHIRSVKYVPDAENASLTVSATLRGSGTLVASVCYEGREVGKHKVNVTHFQTAFTIQLAEKHLWEPGNGRLYDVDFFFAEDRVKSYFGLRSIKLDNRKFYLNGKSVFQRLVLDQGYYPESVMTAPSDEALAHDIQLSLDAGFNGARLHQKVFEKRFLYHCDRMGYMVWGEMGDWGLDLTKGENINAFLPEWVEVIQRDFNHPSIIGWCPFNETYKEKQEHQCDAILENIYWVTKALDNTRPCIDTSGYIHVVTDIYDVHDYEQNPEVFRANYADLKNNNICERSLFKGKQKYRGEPFFVSEYGGIRWSFESAEKAWGYGEAPKTLDEYYDRYEKLTVSLLENENVIGFCYTQLYDVEQEQNGIYFYDRSRKFDLAPIRRANRHPAKSEE